MLETSISTAAVASVAAEDMSIYAPGDSSKMCCITEEDSVSRLFDSISSKNVVRFHSYEYIEVIKMFRNYIIFFSIVTFHQIDNMESNNKFLKIKQNFHKL